MDIRMNKKMYYLNIADSVSARSTCLRRKYGAVIVKRDEIVSTGYNGAPRGRRNCVDICECKREKMNVHHGERYELCRSVHAEMNAIISASRKSMYDGCLYLSGRDAVTGELLTDATCCDMCRRCIINAGISKVFIKTGEEDYKEIIVRDWVYRDDDTVSKKPNLLSSKYDRLGAVDDEFF